MRIVISTEELRECGIRFQGAALSLGDLRRHIGGILQQADWETRNAANVDRYVNAACVRADALSAHAEDMFRFLTAKAAVFRDVDTAGAGELSDRAAALLAGAAPRPEWAALEEAKGQAARYLSAGALLCQPREEGALAVTRLARVAWQGVKDAQVGDRLLGMVTVGAGVFSFVEGGGLVLAGVALLATGPVGIAVAVAGLVLGGTMMAYGLGDIVEGGMTAIDPSRSFNPVKEVFRLLIRDRETADLVYNGVGIGTMVLNMGGASAKIMAKAASSGARGVAAAQSVARVNRVLSVKDAKLIHIARRNPAALLDDTIDISVTLGQAIDLTASTGAVVAAAEAGQRAYVRRRGQKRRVAKGG